MGKKNFIVYMHYNKINGKKYIGITSQKVKRRWRKNGEGYHSCTLFYRAINKYGWESFEHIVLQSNLSKEKALEEEHKLIELYKTNNKEYGYNLTSGGDYPILSEETRKKISEKLRGKKMVYKDPQTNKENRIKSWAMNPKRREEASERLKEYRINHPEIFQRVQEENKGIKNFKAQPVRCIELNRVYETKTAAAEAMGGHVTTFYKLSSGHQKTAWGYHWEEITKEEYYEYYSY